jgi:hypothetical protein
MTDVVPIANFRTRLEAELAARLLEGAAVPYVINSQEGMAHGPLGDGATILVRADDVDVARELLSGQRTPAPPRVVRVATCSDQAEADRLRATLRAAGIPALSAADPDEPRSERQSVFVPAAHATRARRAIETGRGDP